MSSSWFRSTKGWCAVCVLAFAGVMELGTAPAMARDAYVANYGSGNVSVIDLATNAVVGTVAVGEKPRDVAITPDGRFAYVTNEAAGTVSVIATASNVVVKTIPLPIPCCTLVAVYPEPRGIAISPDGSTAWVANFGDQTVSAIDTATNTPVATPIEVGPEPEGVAVSADGSSVFVAQRSGDISIVSAATRTVTGTIVDPRSPSRIAIGPHGGRGFVTDSGSNSVTAFNPANGNVVNTIPVGAQPRGIAVAPKGVSAYVADFGGDAVTPIDTSTSLPGFPIVGFDEPEGIAVDPTGSRGYAVNFGGASVTPFDTATNAPLAPITVGSAPSGIAIVPDQGPQASFWVSPVQRRAKSRLTFHAEASKDPDGKIATYEWNFGDGRHAKSTRAIRVHTYRRPGTYTATLTVTDDEGCSTELVFTGQTASCNGTSAATTSAAITVVSATGPVLRLKGARQQRLRKTVNLFARCPREPCAVSARGVVVTTIERRGALRIRRHRLRGARASLAAGVWGRLALRMPRGTRRAARSALRQGGEAEAVLTVVATGESGNQTLRRRTVTLVLPPHRRHG